MRLNLEEGDGEGRLPVVDMENLGRIELQDFEDGPAEENEPFGIVGVITIWGAI